MGNKAPQHTYSNLRVVNDTSLDITSTSVSGVSDHHWAGNCRPDRNFQGVSIPAKSSAERRFALKKQAPGCPFTMTLTFRNGKVDTFRINQKYALGCAANFQHLSKTYDLSYERVHCTLVVTVKNPHDQIMNERAEESNQQGEAALKQKKFDEAIRKFDQALDLAKERTTINTVKKNKSEACNQLGKEVLQHGWDLEKDESEDKSREATSKFDQAKCLFQQAGSLSSSPEYQHNLNIANLKIEGNRLFNKAVDLENEAFKLFEGDKSDTTMAQHKYEQALASYEEAIKKFEDGMKLDGNFSDSVEVTKAQIEGVKKAAADLNDAEFNHNITKVSFDDYKETKNENEEELSRDFQKSIDVLCN